MRWRSSSKAENLRRRPVATPSTIAWVLVRAGGDAEPWSSGTGSRPTRAQIDNVRRALDWAFSVNGDPMLGVALTEAAPAALDAPVAHERVPVTRRPVAVGVDLAHPAQSPPGTPVPACAGCRAPQHRGVRSGDRDCAERSAEDRRGSQRYRLQAPCPVVPMVPRPQLRRLPRRPDPRRPVLRRFRRSHAILSIP